MFALISGAATKQWSRQAPQHCGDFRKRITERLEGRVKGLTPVLPVLLLTNKFAIRCFAKASRHLAAGRNIRRRLEI
jgi:hypothetical protein